MAIFVLVLAVIIGLFALRNRDASRAIEELKELNNRTHVLSNDACEGYISFLKDKNEMKLALKEELLSGPNAYIQWLYISISNQILQAAKEGKITNQQFLIGYRYCLLGLLKYEYIKKDGTPFTRDDIDSKIAEIDFYIKRAQEKEKQEQKQNQRQEQQFNHNTLKMQKCYDILGLTENASEETIKKTYHQLVLEFHPDRIANRNEFFRNYASKRFIEIKNAYEYICKQKELTGDWSNSQKQNKQDTAETTNSYSRETVDQQEREQEQEQKQEQKEEKTNKKASAGSSSEKKKSLSKVIFIAFFVLLLGVVTFVYVKKQDGVICIHKWIEATCTTPKTCLKCGKTIDAPLGHVWADATCTTPKTCKRCGLTEGQTIEHVWTDATCTLPKTCSVCGKTEGLPLGHIWSFETSTEPKRCSRCNEMLPMTNPVNGQVFIDRYKGLKKDSSITINSSTTQAHYIKLKDSSGNDILSFYVAAGGHVTVSAPTGSYYVYFASGEKWYGPKYLFGEETQYSKDSTIQDLDKYTITYTLYPVVNGNFKETHIDASEF